MKLFVQPMKASNAGLTVITTAGELIRYHRTMRIVDQRVLHLY
jgi:hypothetical protein